MCVRSSALGRVDLTAFAGNWKVFLGGVSQVGGAVSAVLTMMSIAMFYWTSSYANPVEVAQPYSRHTFEH